MTSIGPHLLGRRVVRDDRDWGVDDLHARLAALAPLVPPEALLDETVGQAIGDSPFFQAWSAFLVLWRWVKRHVHPDPAPTPPPAPDPADAPAWEDTVVLDQGDYGTCVGNGWAGWGDAAPVEDTYDETDARAIYYESTVIGGSPDDPDAPGGGQQGSSVRDGAKAMQQRARLAAYAFASSVDEVREWLANHGPVVFGTDWLTGMFSPDAGTGLLHLTGQVEGGHCYLCVDYEPSTDTFLFVNSWGRGWGADGRFRIRSADVATLLSQDGEACCAVELPA